jgi:hypothetical protein
MAPTLPAGKPSKNIPPSTSSGVRSVRAWGDQQDPRNLPRAQVRITSFRRIVFVYFHTILFSSMLML